MPEKVSPGPLNSCNNGAIKEAVCVHTNRIYDSCRDKECLEDLRVFPTRGSQEIIDAASTVKCKCTELLCADLSVQEVSFNRGFYAIDIRFFYRIVGEAYGCGNRPQEVQGLAVYDKRVILFGGEGSVRIFNSKSGCHHPKESSNMPTAILEAVDPICLGIKLVDPCNCTCDDPCEIPEFVNQFFCDELVVGGDCKRMLVTLGQFTIVRLERDSQLLIPAFDFCMPTKECSATDISSSADSACDLFRRIKFPTEQFFPSATANSNTCEDTPSCGCR